MSRPVGDDGRPGMMFLQARQLPWVPHRTRGARCRRRVLNRDPGTGAESFVLQFLPGYRQAGPGKLRSDFEFIVVDGSVEINGQPYRPYCYGMHPSAYAHADVHSSSGATLIVITSGGPDELRSPDGADDYRQDRLASRLDLHEREWTAGVDRALIAAPPAANRPAAPPSSTAAPPSTHTKLIWQDPDSGGWTFLKSDLPRRPSGPQSLRSHGTDAEYFVLSGDYIIAGEGRIPPGGYFFWRAGEVHGPSACEELSLSLVKYYGPMTVQMSEERIDATLDPPHRPSVPEPLRRLAVPYAPPKVWS